MYHNTFLVKDRLLLLLSLQQPEASIGDKFVMDIRNYVSVVSDHAAPACLILFGVNYTFWLSLLFMLVDCIQFYFYVNVSCVSCCIGGFVGGYSYHRTYHSKTRYVYCLMVHFSIIT